jgi:hypothetical protein
VTDFDYRAAVQTAAGHAAQAHSLLAVLAAPCRCGDTENCPYEGQQQSTAQLAAAHAATGQLYAALAGAVPIADRAACGRVPAPVRAAIGRIVNYNLAAEASDYAECGTAPGQNSREGHIYPDYLLVRAWLGSQDRQDQPGDFGGECVIGLAAGGSIRTDGFDGNPGGSSYVRVCDQDGQETGYWTYDEWAEAPEEVMGAILGAAAAAGAGDDGPEGFKHYTSADAEADATGYDPGLATAGPR